MVSNVIAQQDLQVSCFNPFKTMVGVGEGEGVVYIIGKVICQYSFVIRNDDVNKKNVQFGTDHQLAKLR